MKRPRDAAADHRESQFSLASTLEYDSADEEADGAAAPAVAEETSEPLAPPPAKKTQKEKEKEKAKKKKTKKKKVKDKNSRRQDADADPMSESAAGASLPSCHSLGYDPAAAADALARNGFVVVRVPWLTPARLESTRRGLLADIKHFPEFKPDASAYVLGGFAALGNPASFHNPSVRNLRMLAMSELVPLFAAYSRRHLPAQDSETGPWRLEQIVDRLLFREPGLSPSAEAWHRDEAPAAKASDCIFGGWWNLNDHAQNFSCIPSSHKNVHGHAGFSTVQDKEEKAQLSKQKKVISVPAGTILVFHEHILHEIVARKLKTSVLRLFIGWRLTRAREPLISDIDGMLDAQAVVPLKSGQIPPMYAKLHWTNWRSKIKAFTEANVNAACTVEREVASGKDKGSKLRVVHQHMKSLQDYGLPLYAPYAHQERAILRPGRSWTLPCGCGASDQARILS